MSASKAGGETTPAAPAVFSQALAAWLPLQRWFGARGRTVLHVTIEDTGSLVSSNAALEVAIAVVRVDFADGEPHRYHVPLATARGESVRPSDPSAVIIADAGGVVFDALADPRSAAVLWGAIADGADRTLGSGILHGHNAGIDLAVTDLAPLGKEQSNSSLVVDQKYLLKCMRRVEFVESPELEMTDALTTGGFEHIAPALASLEYKRRGHEPALLAVVQPFLHNGVEGWALALSSLRDLYATAEEEAPDASGRLDAVMHQGSAFLPEAMRLGTVTGEMHLALIADGLPPAVAPQPVTRALMDTWAAEMLDELEGLLAQPDERLDPLRDGQSRLRAHIELLHTLEPSGLATRIHGDYHLGQVLRTDSGWTVFDFEGEPARSAAHRRLRSSPLRDVAGMLRSFDYAAAVALAERSSPHDSQWEMLLDQGYAWSLRQREAFWGAYLRLCSGTDLLPHQDDALVVRRAFELGKAAYEVRYELGHRPDWAEIPLRFLLRELR